MKYEEDKFEENDIQFEQKEKTGFVAWLDNFWYHYKIPVILILSFALIIIISAAQSCSVHKEGKSDISFIYAGPYKYTPAEERIVESTLAEYTVDLDGNGKKTAAIRSFQVASKEEIQASDNSITNSYSTEQMKLFSDYTMTGEASIAILSEYLYNQLKESERLMDLSAFLPNEAVALSDDGFGVLLSKTELYKGSEELQHLPENTYLCLLRPLIIGESSKQSVYEATQNTFKALLINE